MNALPRVRAAVERRGSVLRLACKTFTLRALAQAELSWFGLFVQVFDVGD
jgi:hypothetical protein